MDHVSAHTILRDDSQPSSKQLDLARNVSHVVPGWRELWRNDTFVDADDSTLHDEVETLHDDRHELYSGSGRRASLGNSMHGNPLESPARHIGDILRAHLEERGSRDVSEDGYILEPESSYQTLLGSKARLKEIERFRQNYYRLGELREDAEALRLRVREVRTALRWDRDTLRDFESATMDRLHLAARESNGEAIVRYQEELATLKDSRDELNKREDEYNILEDQLLSVEWEIRQAEADIYFDGPEADTRIVHQDDLQVRVSNWGQSVSGYNTITDTVVGSQSTAGGSHIKPPRHLPAVSQLTDVRQRQLAIRVELNSIRREREQLSNEQRSRERVRRNLDPLSKNVLDSFPRREQVLLSELTKLADDENQLQSIVLDQDDAFFRPDNFVGHGEDVNSWNAGGEFAHEFEGTGKPVTDAQVAALNELFDMPTMDSGSLTLGFLFYTPYESLSKSDFVNDWLLQVLRSSKAEIQRFVFEVKLPDLFDNLTFSQVRTLVVSCWFRDGSNIEIGEVQAKTISEEPSQETAYNAVSIVTPMPVARTESIQGLLASSTNSMASSGTPGTPSQLQLSTITPSADDHTINGRKRIHVSRVASPDKDLPVAATTLAVSNEVGTSEELDLLPIFITANARMDSDHILHAPRRRKSLGFDYSRQQFATRSLP